MRRLFSYWSRFDKILVKEEVVRREEDKREMY